MNIGDIVIVKSGSPVMVIDRIFNPPMGDERMAECIWFEKGDNGRYKLRKASCNIKSLQPYDVLARLP